MRTDGLEKMLTQHFLLASNLVELVMLRGWSHSFSGIYRYPSLMTSFQAHRVPALVAAPITRPNMTILRKQKGDEKANANEPQDKSETNANTKQINDKNMSNKDKEMIQVLS
jgi:hypothetical protein